MNRVSRCLIVASCTLIAGGGGRSASAEPQVPEAAWENVEALTAGAEIRVLPLPGRQRVEVRSAGPTQVRQLSPGARRRVEIRGSVVEVNSAELVLVPATNAAEEWIIRREDVERVLRVEAEGDDSRNGFLIGAAVGSGAWLALGAGDNDLDALSWEMLLITGSIGAVIGGLSDELRDTPQVTLVYRAPPESVPPSPDSARPEPVPPIPAVEESVVAWCSAGVRPAVAIDGPHKTRTRTLREILCREAARIVIESHRESGEGPRF